MSGSVNNVTIDSMKHERSNAGALEREGNQTCHVERSETSQNKIRKEILHSAQNDKQNTRNKETFPIGIWETKRCKSCPPLIL